MQLSGGPLGGENVDDMKAGAELLREVGDRRGRLARYECRLDEESGELFAVFTGLVPAGGK